MTSVEIISLIVTFIGVASFAAVFTILYLFFLVFRGGRGGVLVTPHSLWDLKFPDQGVDPVPQ